MLSLFFLILGFIPLIYGAELLVDASSSLAKRMDIPNIVIGLTIVAFGTSAPELIVNVFSSIDQYYMDRNSALLAFFCSPAGRSQRYVF